MVIEAIVRLGAGITLVAALFASSGLSAEIPSALSASLANDKLVLSGKPVIMDLRPERAEGRGYELSYFVDAPLDATWKFKTDFATRIVLSNKFIRAHRLVSQHGNEVVTEAEYSNKPKAVFRWQTTLLPDQHLLQFVLLNPEECGQKYHYGSVKMEALASGTRITQVAFFDFFGVSLWANYPFYGGMSHFLKYMAHWEQQTIVEFKDTYQE